MRSTVTLLLLTMVVSTVTSDAQTSRVESGRTTHAGFDFHWETRLVPPIPPLGDSLGMFTLKSGTDTVHRVMLDRTERVYFGYDARIAVVGGRVAVGRPDERVFRITFQPLTLTPQLEQILGDPKQWKPLPAPRFPESRTIRSGEVLELTLLANSARGQRMLEFVTIQEPPPSSGFNVPTVRRFTFAAGAPRDISASDVELRLVEPIVTMSRAAKAGPAPETLERLGWTIVSGTDSWTGSFKTQADAEGAIVWIYLPGRGRFLLSLLPRAQFVRAGDVRGTTLQFIVDGQTYYATTAQPIAPGSAAFNLYVLHQPAWKPSYRNANLDTVHIGAADRSEYLTEKQ